MSAPKSQATKRAKAQASNVADFKKRKKGSPLELPSGLVVVARRVELRTFLTRGKGEVPNPLMTVIEEALNKGQSADIGKIAGVEEGEVNMDMVMDMYEMVNSVVIETVVSPKVHPLPTHDEEGNELEGEDAIEEAKDEELLYIDEVDDEDKMFLFSWATGGTSDLATFRSETGASMDALAQGSVGSNTPQRTTGA